jgi:hypothetical protein
LNEVGAVPATARCGPRRFSDSRDTSKNFRPLCFGAAKNAETKCPGDVAATAKRALNPVDKLAGLVQMLRTVLAVVHDLRAREPECHANYRRANGDVSAPWPVLAPCHCRNSSFLGRDRVDNLMKAHS